MDKELLKIVGEKYHALEPFLTERTKRVWAAEAKAIGRGGKAVISEACQIITYNDLSRLT